MFFFVSLSKVGDHVAVHITHGPSPHKQQNSSPSNTGHPQIQPMSVSQFNSQYVPTQLLPIQYSQTKSVSVNDFTGSILAADRVNYYNKQQFRSSNGADSSCNRVLNESLYSNLIKPKSSRSMSTAINTTANTGSNNGNGASVGPHVNRIPILSQNIPLKTMPADQQFAEDRRKRSMSEKIELPFEQVSRAVKMHPIDIELVSTKKADVQLDVSASAAKAVNIPQQQAVSVLVVDEDYQTTIDNLSVSPPNSYLRKKQISNINGLNEINQMLNNNANSNSLINNSSKTR